MFVRACCGDGVDDGGVALAMRGCLSDGRDVAATGGVFGRRVEYCGDGRNVAVEGGCLGDGWSVAVMGSVVRWGMS